MRWWAVHFPASSRVIRPAIALNSSRRGRAGTPAHAVADDAEEALRAERNGEVALAALRPDLDPGATIARTRDRCRATSAPTVSDHVQRVPGLAARRRATGASRRRTDSTQRSTLNACARSARRPRRRPVPGRAVHRAPTPEHAVDRDGPANVDLRGAIDDAERRAPAPAASGARPRVRRATPSTTQASTSPRPRAVALPR